MRERHERIHGPYRRGRKWRVIAITAAGARATYSFASEADAHEGIADLRAESSAAQGRTVSETIADYVAHLTAEGFAPGTVETAGHRLRSMLRVREHDRPLADLTPAIGRQLYKRRQTDVTRSGKRVAPDTHRGELTVAGEMCTWAAAQGWLDRNPFAGIDPAGRKRAGRGKAQLRVDESRVLMDHLLELCAGGTVVEAVAVLCALLLGPRASEVVLRDVRDLDDGGRLLWIPDAKTDSGRRTLEIPEVLRPLLLDLARGRSGKAPLFIATDAPTAKRKRGARRATRDWLYYHCGRLCAAAGVPEITPQALRRTHGSIANEAGATAELVAAQLGHGSIAVQKRSYVAPGAAETGRARRVMRLLHGGRP